MGVAEGSGFAECDHFCNVGLVGEANGVPMKRSRRTIRADWFPRSAPDYGRRVVHVRDFGAKCDGVTDDSEAFRLAVASGADVIEVGQNTKVGRSVYLPAKCHRCADMGQYDEATKETEDHWIPEIWTRYCTCEKGIELQARETL